MKETPEKIILGVDPGTLFMGYGIIMKKGHTLSLIDMGVLKLKNIKDPWQKLQFIFDAITGIINKYSPDEMAIEGPFYGVDAQVMLKLGRAQGSAIIAAVKKSVPVFEYQPLRIKQAVTGNGRSSKEQVAGMVMAMFKLKEQPEKLDITDALAVAICHANQDNGSARASKGKGGWDQYIKDNPGKIR